MTVTEQALQKPYARHLLSRFLRYVRMFSQSDTAAADAGLMPSTPQQKEFAQHLKTELESLGLQHVQTTEFCYTYGMLPPTAGFEHVPAIALLAHIDTSDEVSGKNVQPVVHERYQGTPIQLDNGIVIDPATDTALAGSQNDTIITGSGSTLLGADDKAGVAEIITALDFLQTNPHIPHGTIEVLFSPDEETGHGMDKVPLALLKAKQCYTVDGGHLGELETECFNAFKSTVTFTGKAKHTGTARPDLVNAVNMAASFISNLPRQFMPETTDGYQGFYAPISVSGSMEQSSITVLLRDFSMEEMTKKQHVVELVAHMVAATFGGTVHIEHRQQYLNMKAGLEKNPAVVHNLIAAYKAAGVVPNFQPIRGGTDGSRLTELGIPTPNIFTGGHNFHSRSEWASLSQMVCATEVLIKLAEVWSKEGTQHV